MLYNYIKVSSFLEGEGKRERDGMVNPNQNSKRQMEKSLVLISLQRTQKKKKEEKKEKKSEKTSWNRARKMRPTTPTL